MPTDELENIKKILEEHEARIKNLEGKNLGTEISKINSKKIINIKKQKENENVQLIKKLIEEDKFWENPKIRLTAEIQDRLRIKFGKSIGIKNAARDFLVIAKSGILARDWIDSCKKFPKGAFIWFVPSLDKSEIEKYKSELKDGK